MEFLKSFARGLLKSGARNIARNGSDEDVERMSRAWEERGDDSVFRDAAKILGRERRKREHERLKNNW